MTKVVRAFSLDPRVSDSLDEMTRVPGRSKPMNKSRYVNEALDWYMNKNLGEFIKEWDQTRTWYQEELEKKRLTIGGLEHDLTSLRATVETKPCDCVSKISQAREFNQETKYPGLWFRLKRILKRSQVEPPEQ